jgi:hypothetical protein
VRALDHDPPKQTLAHPVSSCANACRGAGQKKGHPERAALVWGSCLEFASLGELLFFFVDDQGLVAAQDGLLADEDFLDTTLRGDLVHDVEHGVLEDGA